jgi:hypothetical protein
MKFKINKSDQILASVWNWEGILLAPVITKEIENIEQAKKMLISQIPYDYINKKIQIGIWNLDNETEKLFSCFARE